MDPKEASQQCSAVAVDNFFTMKYNIFHPGDTALDTNRYIGIEFCILCINKFNLCCKSYFISRILEVMDGQRILVLYLQERLIKEVQRIKESKEKIKEERSYHYVD